MRLFRKRKPEPAPIPPTKWDPNYLVAERDRPVWGWILGRTAGEVGRLPWKELKKGVVEVPGLGYVRPRTSSVRPISEQAIVLRWGNLSREKCAHVGLEAFVGMISVRHGENCHHFWCSPPGDMNIVVEFYLSGVLVEGVPEDQQSTDQYIGAYLFPLQYNQEGSASGYNDKNPVQKLTIQPLSDGSLHVFKGTPTRKYGGPSAYDGGIIDDDTREAIRVLPRRMPQTAEDTTGEIIPRFGLSYLANERKWHMSRILSNNEIVPIPDSSSPRAYDTFEAYRQLR